MGCGAGAIAPVLLASFETAYADVIINDKSTIIMAKRFFSKVETVRYDDVFTPKPKKVKETMVWVDDSRCGVYKGDTVNINTAEQMNDVREFNAICNGVEMHVMLHPQDAPPERFVISLPDEGQWDFTIRHDPPGQLAEMGAPRFPSERSEEDVPTLLASPVATGHNFAHLRSSPDFEKASEQPQCPNPKLDRSKTDAAMFQRLSEEKELQEFGDSDDEGPLDQNQQQLSPLQARRHSISGADGKSNQMQLLDAQSHEDQQSLSPHEDSRLQRQRRHSMSRTDAHLHHTQPLQCLDAQANQSQRELSPPSPHRQRRHSISGAAGRLHQMQALQCLDAQPNQNRRELSPAALSPQRQRQHSVARAGGDPLEMHPGQAHQMQEHEAHGYEKQPSHRQRRRSLSGADAAMMWQSIGQEQQLQAQYLSEASHVKSQPDSPTSSQGQRRRSLSGADIAKMVQSIGKEQPDFSEVSTQCSSEVSYQTQQPHSLASPQRQRRRSVS